MDPKRMLEMCLFIIFSVFIFRTDSLTRQQLINSSKILKKTCMSKNQVTEDQVGNIVKGDFVEDKQVMCYIACIYEMSNIILQVTLQMSRSAHTFKTYNKVKNNKLNYDASIKQVELLYPVEVKASTKAAIGHCKDIQKKYKDLCEASFWTAKCIYEFKPEDFIFP